MNNAKGVVDELRTFSFQLQRWRTLSGISAVSLLGFGVVAYFVLAFTPMPPELAKTKISAPLFEGAYEADVWLWVTRIWTDIMATIVVTAFAGSGIYFVRQLERMETMKQFETKTRHLRKLIDRQ